MITRNDVYAAGLEIGRLLAGSPHAQEVAAIIRQLEGMADDSPAAIRPRHGGPVGSDDTCPCTPLDQVRTGEPDGRMTCLVCGHRVIRNGEGDLLHADYMTRAYQHTARIDAR
jgi:hypothetical protein